MLWYGEGTDTFNLGFTYADNEKRDPDQEMDLFRYALEKLHAKQIKFSLTSMDSCVEEYIVNNSLVRIESGIYDNDAYSQDRNVILAMKSLIEDRLKLAA